MMVGIFWFVDGVLVSKGCPLSEAFEYGDCLTFEGGHAEAWDHWQSLGAAGLAKGELPASILTSEYDEHPRGRIVKEPNRFVLYADRRLQTKTRIEKICARFELPRSETIVRSDPHYRPITFE